MGAIDSRGLPAYLNSRIPGIFTISFLLSQPLRNGDFSKKKVFRPQEKSQFGIAQRFSFRKYPKNAQT